MRSSILSICIVLITTCTFLTSCNSPAPTKDVNEGKEASQDQLEDIHQQQYSPKELQEDYSILRKALETTYPSLYRFKDSVTITQYLDEQVKGLDRSMTEPEFYKHVALTCARANDEHLIPRPSKGVYVNYLIKSAKHFFPFSLKIIDRKFYVLKRASSNSEIPLGCKPSTNQSNKLQIPHPPILNQKTTNFSVFSNKLIAP